jgi:hypothetical protein
MTRTAGIITSTAAAVERDCQQGVCELAATYDLTDGNFHSILTDLSLVVSPLDSQISVLSSETGASGLQRGLSQAHSIAFGNDCRLHFDDGQICYSLPHR